MGRTTTIANGVSMAVIGAVGTVALAWAAGINPLHLSTTPAPSQVVTATASPTEAQEIDCWDDASCATSTITEDDPRWNCLTMGNRRCGPAWTPVPEAVYPSLPVSDDEQCVWLVGDTTTIVCSDGQVFTS